MNIYLRLKEEEEDEEEWPRLLNRFPMPVPHLVADSIVASDVPIPWKDADVYGAALLGPQPPPSVKAHRAALLQQCRERAAGGRVQAETTFPLQSLGALPEFLWDLVPGGGPPLKKSRQESDQQAQDAAAAIEVRSPTTAASNSATVPAVAAEDLSEAPPTKKPKKPGLPWLHEPLMRIYAPKTLFKVYIEVYFGTIEQGSGGQRQRRKPLFKFLKDEKNLHWNLVQDRLKTATVVDYVMEQGLVTTTGGEGKEA
uniref:Uncharacterized protein n=1 Tax=Chromera velia CCMP2878 TaxID=1169474 RepID=A0A0G4FXW2_9ALVE|eukprot:Cvel_19333.t1-p1 / transcript=Cvel_19333.t1 / gene=Cvel_19333 / organism=Chromera_velia_CCMP2878 / gene_product=hypothetical protein / transcript_product=hypothetical protein / location=Cvel_scaffold1659:19581-24246(-) / protein_length=254 / sequence_SO=supercontig / SO=protein_coding / is_pseudo=false